MLKFASRVALLSVLLLGAASLLLRAQLATGTITGTVTDQSGAVVPAATITIINKSSGAARPSSTNDAGRFSAPALLPGDYEIHVEKAGFRTEIRNATVTAGGVITVDAALQPGESQQTVNVEAAAAQLNFDTQSVSGVVARNTIQELPLNGRNYLQLATLEPGVTITPGFSSQSDATVSVIVLGQSTALFTIDGGDVNDTRAQSGKVSMTFSQEVVQEFQLSSVNVDNSTGVTTAGTVNVVTRSGGNDFHGSAYFYYRDHNLAGYPALSRNPFTPNPFFQRKNPGFVVSGPIKKDKAFFFFNLERMWQVQNQAEQQDLPSLQPLNGNFPSPYHNNLITVRFDYLLSPKNSLFLRYSHDGNFQYGPYDGTAPTPSSWDTNANWSDQAAVGLTTTFTSTIVNDFRATFHPWLNTNLQPTQGQCYPPCVGYGLPSIVSMQGSATFHGGVNDNSSQTLQVRIISAADTLNWQKGTHRIRFGADEELVDTNEGEYQTCLLSCLSLYSPETTASLAGTNLATYFPGLPSKISTTQDLLNLPVYLPTPTLTNGVAVGTQGRFPGGYGESARYNLRTHPWVADSWKLRPNLTVNFGLAYFYQSGLFIQDLPYPQFLAPIVGQNAVGTSPKVPGLDFSPTLGFSWSPFKDNKTVIRGGAGIFWGTLSSYQEYKEGFSLGPPGDGRATIAASIFSNPFPGIFDVTTNKALPVGASLPLQQLTTLSLAQYIQILNAQLPAINALFPANPTITSGPIPVDGIDLVKQGFEMYLPHTPVPRSYQTSIGIQRQLPSDIIFSADWARNQSEHLSIGETDLNRTARYINGKATPVIPTCAATPDLTLGDECSTGSITFWPMWGRSVYEGLLVKVQKRMTKRYQFTASYALQNLNNLAGSVDLDHLRNGYGPTLARQNFNFSGLASLPWGFSLSLNSSMISLTPVTPTIAGVDLNGSGNTSFPITEAIPAGTISGLSYNCFNAGCGKTELANAVAYWNSNLSGTKDARNTTLPKLILPANYQLGHSTIAQDVRLTKRFSYKERYHLDVFGEVFNIFNIANLTAYSFVLNTVSANPATQSFSFGQPTARTGSGTLQTFGSGGPRAVQFGARFSF